MSWEQNQEQREGEARLERLERQVDTILPDRDAAFRVFLETASEAVIVSNTQGEIIIFNGKAEEIFGYTAREILGQPIEVLLPERFRYAHRGFRADYYTQPTPRSMGQSRNLFGRRKDGSEFSIEAGLSAVQIGNERFVLTFLTDITERKRAEETLRQREEHLRRVLQNMPVMLDAIGTDGNLMIWNQECERVTGYSAQEMIGNPAAMEWLYPDPIYRQHLLEEWSIRGNRYRNWEWDLVCKDGSIKTIAWSNLSEEFPIPGWASWGIGIDVTERKQAEIALREVNQVLEQRVVDRTAELSQLNQRLQQELAERQRTQQLLEEQAQLLDLAHDPIMTRDMNGVITFWNRGAERMYGWTKEEAIAQSSHQLLHTQFPRPLAELEAELWNHDYWEGELIHVRRDGTALIVASRWVLQRDSSGAPLKVLEINNDITERKRTEEALVRLAAIVESSEDGIISTTLDGTITSWNAGAEKIYGYTREEILGKPVEQLLPGDRQHEERQILEQLKQGLRIEHYETVRRCKTGQLMDISLAVSPIKNVAGEIIGISKIVRDITVRKQAEAQLLLSNERISLANAELARAARLKDEFLAGMSHELRTPLNSILGLSEALLEEIFGSLTSEQQESIQTIEQSGKHLLNLITDILDLSKIESGKMELQITPVSLHTLWESGFSFVKQQAHMKNIKLSCQIAEGLTEIEADERRLLQVIVNLLSNAVKFTAEGGIVTFQIQLDAFQESVEFIVTDTGIGIAPENLDKLFQPFVQLDSSLSRRYAGTGLGLALVRRIVELHGGSIRLDSEEGVGSRFTLTLPRFHVNQPVLPLPPQESLEGSLSGIQQVLVVEDSQAAANQISRYLAELGATTEIQPVGEGALEIALRSKPDLIILDILLPGSSGWEVLAELKANPQTKSIPVIVMSVLDERSRSLTLGAMDHLLKPISRQQFHQVLHQMLPTEDLPHPHTALILASPDPSDLPLLLLAEDNEANIITLRNYLSAHGFRLLLARNGLEAVQMAKYHRPDLILMDIQMPEMDGLEATRRIHADPETASIPIIALTALAMPGDRERCLAAGARDYLTKPVRLKQLLHLIVQLIPSLQHQEETLSHE